MSEQEKDVCASIQGKTDNIVHMRQMRAYGGSCRCRACEGAQRPIDSRCAKTHTPVSLEVSGMQMRSVCDKDCARVAGQVGVSACTAICLCMSCRT